MSEYWDYDERSSLTAGYLFTGKCLSGLLIFVTEQRNFQKIKLAFIVNRNSAYCTH